MCGVCMLLAHSPSQCTCHQINRRETFFESLFAFLQVKRKRMVETRIVHEKSRLESDGELFEQALAVRIQVTKRKSFYRDKCLFTRISTATGSIQYIITSSFSLFSTPFCA